MPRRLVAILAADVVGYTRLMGEDEAGTLERLKSLRSELVQPKIEKRGGRIFKLMGDGLLAAFSSVVEALRCAVDIQNSLVEREFKLPGAQRIRLRIGVNLGDVIVEGSDIYGDGVNVAARLEGLANPGGICVSGTVFDHAKGKIELEFADLGKQQFKNIADPIQVYRIVLENPLKGDPTADTSESDTDPRDHTKKPAIAVLPFANMSGDAEQEYFSDGITEDIITELSRFQELFVIARNSSFSYKGKSVKIQEIARDLGVDFIVEGSVRKAGNRVRITAQLIEAANANHIWAERFDRTLDDIFDLQDEITQVIVALLPIRLQGALIERARKKPSANLTAYDLFLQGRWLLDQTFWQNRKALELLGKATEIDPHCAHAYAYIALVHAYSVFTFAPLGEDPIATARENLELALSNGEGDHFIHAVAGEVYLICGEHDRARIHSEKSLTLNPNDIFALHSHADVVAYSGDPEYAVDLFEKVHYLDPMAPDIWMEIHAESHYMMRDYKKALDIYQSWENAPAHSHTHMAACFAQLGQMDEAHAAAETFRRICPDNADFAYYASAHARLCKRPEDAAHWLEGYRKAGLMA